MRILCNLTNCSLVQNYPARPDSVYCIVFWFMNMAWLDDAFEDVSTPAELWGKRNPGISELHIKFKASKMSIPITRRMEGLGSRKLSDFLPLSSDSFINDGQRIARAMGLPQRWTPYAIRRGVSNAITGSKFSGDRVLQHFPNLVQAIVFMTHRGNKFWVTLARLTKSSGSTTSPGLSLWILGTSFGRKNLGQKKPTCSACAGNGNLTHPRPYQQIKESGSWARMRHFKACLKIGAT